MTRTVPASGLAAIQSDAFKLPMLVHIAWADGSVSTLTDWDVPLVVDLLGDGALSYTPSQMAGLSAFSAQINAPIDDSELVIIIDDVTLTYVADDVRRGAYNNAIVTRGYVVPTDLANPWVYCVYDSGQAKINGLRISMELMGPEKRLEQNVARVLTVNCPHKFGDRDCGIQITAHLWQASHAYALHQVVQRATGTGIYWFKVTDAGTSGGSEPVWPATVGGTVTDGGVEWTAFRARYLTGTVATVTSRRVFTATGITVTNDYFGEGYLLFLDGDNAGDIRRVRSDNGTGSLVLQLGAFDDIQVGDTFRITVGCRKRLQEDCIDKHDNENMSRTRTLRFGGDPFLAPENVTMTAKKG